MADETRTDHAEPHSLVTIDEVTEILASSGDRYTFTIAKLV